MLLLLLVLLSQTFFCFFSLSSASLKNHSLLINRVVVAWVSLSQRINDFDLMPLSGKSSLYKSCFSSSSKCIDFVLFGFCLHDDDDDDGWREGKRKGSGVELLFLLGGLRWWWWWPPPPSWEKPRFDEDSESTDGEQKWVVVGIWKTKEEERVKR